MKPFKIAAMALVAGAGLALVGAQASADTVCGSTSCTSSTSAEISAGVSSGEESSSSTTAAQGTLGIGTTSTTTNDGSTITLGGTSSLGPDSASFAFGSIRSHEEEWRKQGASTESSTESSGDSLAAVFVFGQNIVVHDAELRNDSGLPDTASITGSFLSVAGAATINQSAAVGAQQANLFATVQELDGSTAGPNSGANSLNVTDAQNIIVTADGEVENEEYESSTGDTASITGSFLSVAGAVAVNQTVGVANQQVNDIVIAH